MSLIGPRPMVDGEGAEFPGFVQRRLLVKPGMTGLWQVSGRSDISEHDRVRLDLYYVENWSMDQDLRILVKTAVTVARGHGAY
jgi:lipopolysaccharide/colanic/teichoic acid biosynthesis glycosyltransferase